MPSAAILPRRMTGAGPQARVSRQALLGPPLPAGRCRRRPSELASREVAQHPRPNLQTPSRSNETSWAGTTWSVCPRTPASLLARAEGSPPRTRAAGPGESCAHSWSLSTRLPSPGLEVTLQKRSLAELSMVGQASISGSEDLTASPQMSKVSQSGWQVQLKDELS